MSAVFRTTLAVSAALVLSHAPLPAQAPSPAGPAASRLAGIARATGVIRIDAELDDADWAGATRIRDFVERDPSEGAAPPVGTEVMLTYDDENLYVAFIAADSAPDRIRATMQPRDRIWSDDWVGIILDPYGDASLGYYFLSNPIGVQADMQMTGRSEDSSIDFVYSTAGRSTADGYVVEMAIPFRSLRVPDRERHEWGVMLVRSFPRSSRHYISWPSFSRNNACQLCQLARLEGIQGVESGGNLEFMPAAVVSRGGSLADANDAGSFRTEATRVQPSLGLKYSFRPGWAAEATVNPDFSQVESDVAQVDVNTTFALFYPERRPFFQEGMDLYQSMLNVFYSRSINAPQVAAKLTGRSGRTSIGYVGARDEHTPFVVPLEESTGIVEAGSSVTNVLRLQHNLNGSLVGGLLTDRRLDGGGSGTSFSVDGLWRMNEVYSAQAQLVLSHTVEPDDAELSTRLPDERFGGSDDDDYTAAFDGESYTGHAAILWAGRDARHFSWNGLYLQSSPTYRADAGFESQNNFRRATVWAGYTLYPQKHGVERVTASIWGGGFWNFQGERQRAVFEPGLSFTLPRQTHIGIGAAFQNELFRGVELRGVRDYSLSIESAFSDAVRFGAQVGMGRRVARTLAVPEIGEGRGFSLWATIKPIQQVVIEPSLTYEELDRIGGAEVFSGYVARSAFNYQHNRELNVRAILQYNDFAERLSVEPLLMYQLNPFSIFYLGASSGSRRFGDLGFEPTERQYFAKVQYLFRR